MDDLDDADSNNSSEIFDVNNLSDNFNLNGSKSSEDKGEIENVFVTTNTNITTLDNGDHENHHEYEHFVPVQNIDPDSASDAEPPGPELLFNYKQLDRFDIYAQTFVFISILLAIYGLSLTLHRWKLIRKIRDYVPESIILLIIGALIESLCYLLDKKDTMKIEEGLAGDFISKQSTVRSLNLHAFNISHFSLFSVLIPPIILHASYTLYHSKFFNQIWSILTLAIFGTGLTAGLLTLGLYLFYTSLVNSGMTILHLVTFSSIIAAVDPVAVLAVFEEVQVDPGLYYLVFGEALLNDGVTFVLFEGFRSLAILEDVSEIPLESYIYVILSFLTSPTGGVLCGLFFGIMTALFTRFTTEKVSYLEPGIVLCFGFLSHVTATKLGWSGILALIGCGLAQKRYAFVNLSDESKQSVLNLVKTIAMSCEVLIFVLLGNSLAKSGGWDWQFIAISVVLIYVSRGVVTLFLCFIINRFRKDHIDLRWQAVIYLGGLRGAIANVMVLSYEGKFHEVFSDTTLVIIFLTVILNGLLAKPCINYFDLGCLSSGIETEDLMLPPFTRFEHTFIVPYFIRKRTLSEPSVKCPESLANLSPAQNYGFMEEVDQNIIHNPNINSNLNNNQYVNAEAHLY